MAGARRAGIALAAALGAVLWAGAAGAQTCLGVSATPVAFGDYDAGAGTPLDGEGSVSVTCDLGVAYEVQLDPGANSGGAFFPRRMTQGGTYFLEYNLYLDPTRLQVWGDGASGGGTAVQSGGGTGLQQNFPIYGRIPPLQSVGVGAYADNVTVTLLW